MRSLRRAVIVLALFAGCSSDGGRPAIAPDAVSAPVDLRLEVVAEHPHDTGSFTEGLVFVGARLYETAGGYGTSDIREVEPTTGAVVRSAALPDDEFAEGLGAHDDELVQLTWREGIARSWSTDLVAGETFDIDGEGWGLSYDPAGDRWVQSDGSARLIFRDPTTFEVMGMMTVRDDHGPVRRINELEVVGDVVWANVWKSDDLLRIDLGTGHVTGRVDATELVPDDLTDPEAVLNGIAHRDGDPADRLWLTGKLWPTMYVVDVS
jgi:glutamine cyclotransferase